VDTELVHQVTPALLARFFAEPSNQPYAQPRPARTKKGEFLDGAEKAEKFEGVLDMFAKGQAAMGAVSSVRFLMTSRLNVPPR
jgi:hypothetical protein